MILFSPKKEIRVQALENIKLVTLSYCEAGKVVSLLNEVPGDLVLKPTLIYSLTVASDNMIELLDQYANPDYYTDMNNIQDEGLHIVRLKEASAISDKMYSQFRIKNIKGYYGGEKWCRDSLPWNNTLKEVRKDGVYIFQVDAIYGKTIEAGVKLNGIELLDENSIEGVIISKGESTNGITFLPDNDKFKMRVLPLSVEVNPFYTINKHIVVGNEYILVSIHKDYLGKIFHIIDEANNKIYTGVFDTEYETELQENTLATDFKITFKPVNTNELYTDEHTMFCYCADKLVHIHYTRNYIGAKFYITYKGKTYQGVFDENSSLIDTAVILREYRS